MNKKVTKKAKSMAIVQGIREFYLKNYPTDNLGLELAETPTFAGLLNQLIVGGDVMKSTGIV